MKDDFQNSVELLGPCSPVRPSRGNIMLKIKTDYILTPKYMSYKNTFYSVA